MGIANELSSDVASAVLAHRDERVPFETARLIEIIRNFHSALRDLSNKERSTRVYRDLSHGSGATGSMAASDSH